MKKQSFKKINWLTAEINKKTTTTTTKIKYEFVSNETVTANYFGGLYFTENFINFFGDALTFFKLNSGHSQS